ncbi:hypothetical protein [Novosphingobium mathurense]|uniref:Uncharacterized protein n=1 Tax=Novosphingobium mathurense TaxID=428990 RepID=A0A1U6GWZ3_9SPHN|nr:hypothetical protein [Novosphingobium mathurense]SLJ87960.1 hypothetical protein SAMN06295987_101719 [Novosphingobium mathurense]
MMRKTLAVLVFLSLLAGCEEKDPQEEAAQDAKDIATVERMSREPFKPIVPDPITPVDIDRYGLDRAGCFFRKTGKAGSEDNGGQKADPIFFGDSVDGFLRIKGDLKRFAAKTQSAEFPGGARATYVGLSSWLDIVRLPDAGTGADANVWPARLILHDSQERVAFMADGTVDCSA